MSSSKIPLTSDVESEIPQPNHIFSHKLTVVLAEEDVLCSSSSQESNENTRSC